jgi:hypothetical protein
MKTYPPITPRGSTARCALLPVACVFALALITNLLCAQTPQSPRSAATAYDNAADFSYARSSAIGEGTRGLGEIDSFHARALTVRAVPLDPPETDSTLLAGFGAQWFDFHPPAGSIVPEHLGSMAVKLGLNHQFASPWSARAEIDPGLYGDLSRGNGGGFDAPVALRVVYAANQDLQWVLGANIDWRSGHPVVGGIGVRWHFAPAWTLSLLLPAPRLEWTIAPRVALFAGANLSGGTFRVADDFGRTRGRPALDGQIVDYREISIGAGVRWQASRATALHLGIGRMLDRRFEFHDRNLLLNGDGAAAAQFAVTSAF